MAETTIDEARNDLLLVANLLVRAEITGKQAAQAIRNVVIHKMHRRKGVRRTRAKSKRMTDMLREAIRDTKAEYPNLSHQEIAQIHENGRDRDRKINSAHSRISKQRIVNMSLSAVFGAVGGFFGGMFKGST